MCELGLILSGLLSTGTAYIILTPEGSPYLNLAPYGITGVDRTSLNFSVRGCNNAHIGIYQGTTLYEKMVEFVIGARSNSGYDIREYTARDVVYRVSTPGVLMDCDQFKAFWVAWELNEAGYRSWLLGVGSQVFSEVKANYTDTNHDNGGWVSIAIAPYLEHSLEWDFDIEIQSTTMAAVSVYPETTTSDETTSDGNTTDNETTMAATEDAQTSLWSTTEPTADKTVQACFCRNLTTLSEEDLAAFIKKITKILKVEKKETSSYRRSLISVREDRPSARAIGNLGVLFIVAVIGGICALDTPRFLRFFHIKLNVLRNRFHDISAVHQKKLTEQNCGDAK